VTRITLDGSNEKTFEVANTRHTQSPSGRYSVAYETSSHTREESSDDDNNVRGSFTFETEDDGEEHRINYEAGSATGFVTSGEHLPIGPIVPGAPSGQVTGKLIRVNEVPFVDPLAKPDMDASYNFEFGGEEYSRNEVADEDGNISGTYSVLGEDNIRRTYRFRAGKGIGYEVAEISAVPVTRSSTSTSSLSTRTQGNIAASRTAATSSTASSRGAHRSSVGSTRQSSHRTSSTSHGSHSTGNKSHGSSFSSKKHNTSTSSRGYKVSAGRDSNEVFPGFTLRQYDASEGRGKFGYVLKFDD